nr:MAG TPA: hypothetical protein [Caudoviricetes sp.]
MSPKRKISKMSALTDSDRLAAMSVCFRVKKSSERGAKRGHK